MSSAERNASVAAGPVVEVVLDEFGHGSVDGTRVPELDPADPKGTLLAEVTRRAATLGRPLRVRALDPDGVWHLLAHPDGSVTERDAADDAHPAYEPPAASHRGDEPDLDEPPAPDDGYEPWHLRVHPSGLITSLDEDVPPGWLPPPTREAPPAHPPREDAPADPTGAHDDGGEQLPLADLRPTRPARPPRAAAVSPTAEPTLPPPLLGDRAAPADDTPADDTPTAEAAEPVHRASARPAPDDPDAAPDDPQAAPDDRDAAPDDPDGDPEDAEEPARDRPAPPADPADHLVDELRATVPWGETRPARRSWRRPATVAAAVGTVIVAGGVAWAGVHERDTARVSAAQPTLSQSAATGPTVSAPGTAAGSAPGAAASTSPPLTGLTIGPPPGFSAAPVWTLPVSGSVASVVSADGTVLTLTPDHQVTLVDPQTGAVRWQVPAPAQAAGPYLTRIDGRAVVAMVSTDQLRYWALPSSSAPDASASALRQVALPAGASVTWAGPSPLVTLGDGSPAMIVDGSLQRVNLPSRSQALAADGADVLAVNGADWIRQTAGKPPGVPRRLSPPQGATGAAPRIENVGGSFLAAIWTGSDGPLLAVHDARTGEKVLQATFPRTTDFEHVPTVREAGSDRTALGSAIFEPAQHNLSILAAGYTPVALTPGHVFATDANGTLTDLRIAGKTVTAVRFTSRNPTVPVGIVTAGSRSLAVVVVPNGSGWVMCALPSS